MCLPRGTHLTINAFSMVLASVWPNVAPAVCMTDRILGYGCSIRSTICCVLADIKYRSFFVSSMPFGMYSFALCPTISYISEIRLGYFSCSRSTSPNDPRNEVNLPANFGGQAGFNSSMDNVSPASYTTQIAQHDGHHRAYRLHTCRVPDSISRMVAGCIRGFAPTHNCADVAAISQELQACPSSQYLWHMVERHHSTSFK